MSPYIHWPELCFMASPICKGHWKVEFLAWHMLPNKISSVSKEKGKMDVGPAPIEHTKTTIESVLFRKKSMFFSIFYSANTY